jgi:hypothetical protein
MASYSFFPYVDAAVNLTINDAIMNICRGRAKEKACERADEKFRGIKKRKDGAALRLIFQCRAERFTSFSVWLQSFGAALPGL